MNETVQLNDTVQQVSDLRAFAGVALRRQGVVGAVAPSSRSLARALTAVVPTTGPAVIVELGPGTGAISEAIRERLAPGSRQLAVEIDPGMVAHLRRARPWLNVLQGDAARLGALLDEQAVSRVDAVVSTLPWTLFPEDVQEPILGEVGRVLRPTGAFTTVTYLPAVPLARARRFRRRLRAAFDEVLTTGPVWRNVPPGLAYVCRRPVGRG
ncbi:class I SAM-dependent methyltransferase [Microbispora sp. GKU 823]|uniref:class I SAM-dependent methyltransferase n=1 Tax=Microbispora sp. GKU 823 TaxID=1652100 RepID=UPI0009A43F7E|nr:methyltransferase domain-containing protein [Microbispora sp. GKU 823]